MPPPVPLLTATAAWPAAVSAAPVTRWLAAAPKVSDPSQVVPFVDKKATRKPLALPSTIAPPGPPLTWPIVSGAPSLVVMTADCRQAAPSAEVYTMAPVIPLITAGRAATNPLPSVAMPAIAPPPALAAAGIKAGVHVAPPSADRHAADACPPPAVATVPASTITVP